MSAHNPWLDRVASIQIPALLPQTELPGPSAPLTNWISVVSEDPLLAMQIFRYANRMMSNRQVPVRTLEHAVALIGSQRLIRLTRDIPRLDPDSPAYCGLRSTIGDSLVAASLMRQWFELRQIPWAEADYWMTLFYDVGLWALWLLEPQTMEGFEYRSERGENRTGLMEDLIGMPAKTWNDELCQYFQLPAIPETLPESQTHDIENRVQPYKLAALKFFLPFSHELAYRVRLSWDSEHLGTLCRTGEIALGLSQFRPLLKVWVAKAAREYRLPQVATAARRLLAHQPAVSAYRRTHNGGFSAEDLARDDALSGAAKTGPDSPPEPGVAPAPADTPRPRYRHSVKLNSLREIRRRFRHQKAWQTLVEIQVNALYGLQYGLGLNRIVVMECRDDGWRAFDSEGCDRHPALKRLHLPMATSPVMRQFSRRVSAAWLHPGNWRKARRQLPDELFHAAGEQSFFLRSFSIGETVTMLLYADAKDDSEPLTEADYRLFREFCADWNTALNRSQK